MPRQATERGKAIRDLFVKTKGEITYGQAREELEKAGFEVPEVDTDEKSPYRNDMNSFNVAKYHWKKNNLGGKSIKPRNSKAKRASEAPTKRRKHKGKAQPKFGTVQPEVKVQPKHGKPSRKPVSHVGESFSDSLAVVTKQGGIKASQERIAALRAQADELEGHVNTVLNVQQQLEKVA